MNKSRRKSISECISQIDSVIKPKIEIIKGDLESLADDISVIKEEEQDAIDNFPENLQGTEKYEEGENAVGELDDAEQTVRTAADELVSTLDGVSDQLGNLL